MKQREKIVLVSGEFNTITPKEIKFLKRCRVKGNWLIVGINSDTLLYSKYGFLENDYIDRIEMLNSLNIVDEIFRFNDLDGTVCNLLKVVKVCYPMAEITYISDHDMHNMPETKIKGINFETLTKE